MDLATLMMMSRMGGMGDTQAPAPAPVNIQEAFPNMSRGGNMMAAGLEQGPMFAANMVGPTPLASTEQRKTMFGTMVDPDLAQAPILSATATKKADGMDKAQAFFDKMSADEKMMMMSGGLDMLMRSLRGG